jgi:hypothetical protein
MRKNIRRALSAVLASFLAAACGGGGGVEPNVTTFYSFNDDLQLVELSIIEDEGRAARAVDLSAGNYGYTLKIDGAIVSQGRVNINAAKHAVFTSSSDPNKTWEADITNDGITVTSASIPYDDGGSVALGSFEPDKAASESPPSLNGEWLNPLGNRPAYSFTGNNYVHKNVHGTLSTGTFSLSGSTISFTPSYGAYANFQTPWSQSCMMIGDVFFIVADGQHNFGPYLRPSGNPTVLEGVWRQSGGKHLSLTFIKNLFNRTSDDGYLESGAFNLDDPGNITLKRPSGDTKVPYSLSGNTLTVTGTGTGIPAGTYDKVTFEGTWKNPGSHELTYTFSGNSVALSSNTAGWNWSGTFEINGPVITFKQTSPSAQTWIQRYEFWVDGYKHDGKNLVLQLEDDGQRYYGPFYRTTP